MVCFRSNCRGCAEHGFFGKLLARRLSREQAKEVQNVFIIPLIRKLALIYLG